MGEPIDPSPNLELNAEADTLHDFTGAQWTLLGH